MIHYNKHVLTSFTLKIDNGNIMKSREAKKAFHVGGILGNLQPPDLIFLCVPDLAKGQKRLVTELAHV